MLGPAREVHGGISAVVNNYYEAGLDQKVDLTYLATMKEGSKPKKLMVALFAYLRFCRLIGQYDIVHVNAASDNSFWRKSVFIRKAKKAGKKVLLHQHGGDFKSYYAKELNPAKQKKVRDILDLCDKMLVLSDSWKDYFGTLTDPLKIEVFPNAIPVPEKIKSKEEGALYNVLFLGRICREKGVMELLQAMDHLVKDHPRIRLYLGGIYEDPELRSEVAQRKDYVTYLGWLTGEEKKNYLQKCGILVLPSYFEGFGLVLIEAMAYGCVVVGSSVGGIPEIIDDGKTGILVEPRNTDSLIMGLRKVLEDENSASMLAEQGRKLVRDRYDIDHSVRKLTEIYENL